MLCIATVPSGACNLTEGTFLGPPNNWDTTGVTDMFGMFWGATSFNQPLTWNTSAVEDMSGMFYGATNFNNDIV